MGSYRAVGPYRMDMLVADLQNFDQLCPVLLTADLIAFKGEAVYDAPPVEHLGLRWEVSLGTVNGRIYKISLYRSGGDGLSQGGLSPGDRNGFIQDQKQARAEFEDVSAACCRLYGKATVKQDLRLWATEDGYVVLKSNARDESEYFVDLFLTSRKARDLARADGPSRAFHGAENRQALVTQQAPENQHATNPQAEAGTSPITDLVGGPINSVIAAAAKDGELSRLRAVLNEIENRIGEIPIYMDGVGRAFLHPLLADELRKNGKLEDALREFLKKPEGSPRVK